MINQQNEKFKVYPVSLLLASLLGILASIAGIEIVHSFASRGMSYLLVAILGLFVFGPILLRIIKRSFDLAEPAIWFALYYFVHFGVRAIWNLIFGSPFLGLDREVTDLSLINTALGMSILGLLSFWFGYQRRIGQAIAHSLPNLPCKWNWGLVLPVALLATALGWGIRVVTMVSQAGSITAWLLANKDELLRLAEGITYLNIISSSLISVGLLLMVITIRIKRKKGLWFVSGLLFTAEFMFSFISGSRAKLLFLLLAIIIAYFMTSERTQRTSLKYAYGIGVLVVLGFLLFPLLSAIRFSATLDIGDTFSAVFILDPRELFRIVWYRQHGLDSLALIMKKVPTEVPYTLVSELGLLLVSWIPRKIWPDKPTISLGEIFYQKMVPPGLFPESTSVVVTLPGQFYWDLGIVGVVIGMMLVGILWKFLHEYLVRSHGNLSNSLVVAAIFPSFFIPVEQDLVSVFTGHLFGLFVVLMIVIFFLPAKGIRLLSNN